MKKTLLILKLNHFIFSWYYKRCGDHFKQYHFLKSIKLLIDNYEHLNLLYKNEQIHNRNLTRDNDIMRNELFQIRIKQVASPNQIDSINKMFGTNIHKNNEN